MRFAFGVGLIAVLLFAGVAQGAPAIIQPTAVRPDDLPQIQVLSSNEDGVSLSFELPTIAVEEFSQGAKRFQLVAIPGGGLAGDVGRPSIPTFTRFVSIPDDAAVTITAVPEAEEEMPGYNLVPMQGDDGEPFAYDDAAYARDGFGDAARAAAGAPAILRDMRVVALTFRPIQYNPARQTIRVASRMRVDVRFAGKNPENVRSAHRDVFPPSFDRLYRELVVNYGGAPAGGAVQPGVYLLIAPNDNAVTTRLQPLVDWHKRKGTPIQLVTTAQTGTSREQIKAYIQNVYDTSNPPLEYVCLAGDATTPYSIPTWYENISGYSGEGDHPYTQLEGGDVLADINIGRLSFSNLTELEVIVNKVVGYEGSPTLQDPGWFKRACLVGDPYQSGYSTVQVQQWIKNRLRDIGWTEIDTVFTEPFVSQMSTNLNKGDALFSYRGYYGMSGWGNSSTYALTNGWKLPFVVTITCDTGSFASGTSRSEGFLRANSNATSPKGGIGAIGTSTIGTHTRFNNCMHYGILYGLLYEEQYTMGAALTRGKLELYLNYQDVDPNRVYIWSHWNNLMGDPGLEVWTGFPNPLTVSHPASLPTGANAVTIGVEDAGQPAEGAQVCLWKGDETYAVGFTDAQGQVELPVSTPTAGNMMVTVSKHDHYTYQGTISVAGQQRYVSYFASTIDDDNAGESQGNGDATPNPGETVELRVQLRNYGMQAAPGVAATLTTTDPYVAIQDADETFGDINVGSTAWSADDFDFVIDRACPHGHVIRFGLDITSGGDQWHSLIDVPVVAADLEASTYTLYNAGANSLLDPGETVQLSVKLNNVGGADAVTPTATLYSQSEFIDVPEGTGNYSTINAGGSAENSSDTFTIHAAPATYEGYVATLKLILDFSGGTKDTTFVQVTVGTRSTDDPTGPDAYGYYAFDNTDAAYPEAPVYNWIELDPTYGGSGATEIVLGDNGDYQDKSRVVDMPFSFQYYGASYSKATVCSNGWLAMGSQYTAEYRNWTIPGAGGPDAMIAAFWDDLYQQGGGKVFQKYDAANHVWIVEWSRLKNIVNGQPEVVEAILRDPAFYPTETGDGEIILQYNTVSNPDGTDGYCTVGIENATQSDGVLYTWYNRYTPGSASLATGRAIRFIPTREVLAGQIRGTVRNESAGGIPIPSATVTVLENGHEYTTSVIGSYEATEAPGIYTLRASHAGFEPDTVGNVAVVAGGSVVVDFALRDILAPVITSTPVGTTNDTIGPYIVNATITDASPLSEARVFYRVNGGSFLPVNMSHLNGDNYRGEIPGQPWTSKVEYYIYGRDAGGNEATDPAEAPGVLYVFFVAPTVSIFFDDLESERGWLVGSPGDDATSGLWVRVDPNGTWHGSDPVQPEDDHTLDPGVNCWVTGNAAAGAGEAVGDVDGGQTTLTSPPLFPPVEGTVVLRYYRWFTNNTGTNPNEDAWVAQISDDDGATWRDLERTTVSDRSWRFMEFNLADYGVNTLGAVRLRFIAEDALGASIVEAAVDDIEVLLTGQVATDAPDQEIVHRFDLSQNQPNPFNPRTAIRFSLDRPAAARVVIYDVQGREVRRLVDEARPAGAYTVIWDGRDAAGRPVASGIYLYRLDAAGRSLTKKMILLQ